MKILHICLACFYIDGYSYQENILPKYHKKFGSNVKIIASLMTFDKNGKRAYLDKASRYINEYGIEVERLAFKRPVFISKYIRVYKGLEKSIKEFLPDIIFVHGVQFCDINIIRKYVFNNKNVKLYVDNHSDFSNSVTNWVSKNIQHKLLWGYLARKINPYVNKFYGVLPARVDFLVDMYHLPKEKVELLVMGADDEYVEKSSNQLTKKQIRAKHNIDENDFLIVTGGKIDQWKQQTLLLMDAVNSIALPNVKLIVFGSVTKELEENVLSKTSESVQYIGWLDSTESYNYFDSADLVCFPGRHSVFWEQVAGQGIPMLVKYWDGTTDIDCGGNTEFLYKDSENEIKEKILELINNSEKYIKMNNKAQEVMRSFCYSVIAKESIEMNG